MAKKKKASKVKKSKAETKSQEKVATTKSEGEFPDVLTIDQAGAFLQLSRATIYRLLNEDEIPFKRVGKRYRFSKRLLLEWIEKGD